MSHTIRTFTGQLVDPAHMKLDQINIRDIAHGLAGSVRYAGQSNERSTVAEHSVRVSYLCDAEDALHGLLHDSEEAYLKDMPKPVKSNWWLWPYRWVGERLRKQVFKRFELSPAIPDSVHWADREDGRDEKHKLFVDPQGWHPMSMAEAEFRFLQRFVELTQDKVQAYWLYELEGAPLRPLPVGNKWKIK